MLLSIVKIAVVGSTITLGLRLSLDLDKGAVGNGLLIKTKAIEKEAELAKQINGKKITKEWAKHLRKYGKRQANKKLRKANKI